MWSERCESILERKSHWSAQLEEEARHKGLFRRLLDHCTSDLEPLNVRVKASYVPNKTEEAPGREDSLPDEAGDTVLGTFERAANILRQSLEIDRGGVVFFDTAVAFSGADPMGILDEPVNEVNNAELLFAKKNCQKSGATPTDSRCRDHQRRASSFHQYKGQVRSSEDQSQAAKVIARSVSGAANSELISKPINGKILHRLLDYYPDGNVWYFDHEGFFASMEQVEELDNESYEALSSGQRVAYKRLQSQQQGEATVLAEILDKARQIVFLPLWDVAAKRWYAGCIVWSQSAVPVFTVDSEVAYLASFTNSVMAEVSRLDAISSDRKKVDLISSISRTSVCSLQDISWLTSGR